MNLLERDKAAATAEEKIKNYINDYGSLHSEKSVKWMRRQKGWRAVKLMGWMASKGWLK